ncbi:MAG: nitrite reductase small subunit NirD [Pontibacterium sp.]
MTTETLAWQKVCTKADLVAFSGIAALVGEEQVAIFYMPGVDQEIFAVANHDPFSGANVIARGIVGDLKGELVVASPLYKQHFCLKTGICQEDESQSIKAWNIRFNGDDVEIEA